MGLFTNIAVLRAAGKLAYRVFSTRRKVRKALESGLDDLNLLDVIEEAIEEAEEYGKAFGATGEQKCEKAARKVRAALSKIDAKRGYKVGDHAKNREHVRLLVSLWHDIGNNREADAIELAEEAESWRV